MVRVINVDYSFAIMNRLDFQYRLASSSALQSYPDAPSRAPTISIMDV